MVDFRKELLKLEAIREGIMAGTAQPLTKLWGTKKQGMYTAELDVSSLDALVKAAKVQQKTKVKFLAFMGLSQGGKGVIDILAEPCDPYVKGQSMREPTAALVTP